MENVVNAMDFGFLPTNSGAQNSKALNEAIKNGGEIRIDLSGTYEISDTIYLKSNTTLIFGENVWLKRKWNDTETAYLFVNEGAYTHTYNENIRIHGLKLICNGVYCKNIDNGKLNIPGLNGHISLFYVKNTSISGFEVYDLPETSFAIHICTFENIIVENCKIEGKKDGVHLGRGKNFAIRNCIFKTFDDPIALNAHDYAISNPQLGWIENGIIENCTDLDDTDTTGFFCQILAGSWTNWQKNMVIRNSDTVVSGGRVYRALMSPDNTEYISVTPPVHEKGAETIDGINWVVIQDDITYNCGCRNILFKNIRLQKKRPVAFSVHFDDDCWSHSFYPGSEAPIQTNIVFEDISIENKIPVLINSVTPLDKIKIISTDLKNSVITLDTIRSETLPYPRANFEFENIQFDSFISDIIVCKNLRKADFIIK